MNLSRRKFFGAAAAGVAAVPGIAAAASEGIPYASGSILSDWPTDVTWRFVNDVECGPEMMDVPRGARCIGPTTGPMTERATLRASGFWHPDVHSALLIHQKALRS